MGIRYKYPSHGLLESCFCYGIKWREMKGHWGVTKIGYTMLYTSGSYQGLTLHPPPGDIWPYLQIFLVVTTLRGSAIGI